MSILCFHIPLRFCFPAAAPTETVFVLKVICSGIDIKKAGQLYPLLVPLFEAFALPTYHRTSNAEAHAECIIIYPQSATRQTTPLGVGYVYIHPDRHLSLPCRFGKLGVCEVPNSQRQSAR